MTVKVTTDVFILEINLVILSQFKMNIPFLSLFEFHIPLLSIYG